MADRMMTSSMTSRDHRVHGRDPSIFKARYFENGLRQRLSFNGEPSPSPTLHKSCKKIHLADICTL